MRYFSYNEPVFDEDNNITGDIIVTKSEEDLKKEFWPYWYDRMCFKFGKEHVDKNYSFKDCLEGWIAVNWAWEVEE